MRRALLGELPAWTAFYGLKPPDVEHMTFREIAEYRRQYADWLQRTKEASGGS